MTKRSIRSPRSARSFGVKTLRGVKIRKPRAMKSKAKRTK
jgi:hypothetical protein